MRIQRSQRAADRAIRRVGVQSDVPIRSLCRKERPRRLNRLGRCLPVPVANSHSVDGKDFEQVVLAVAAG